MRDKNPGKAEVEAAYKMILDQVSFRTSKHRATQAYREEMAGVLLRETLQLAWERSGS